MTLTPYQVIATLSQRTGVAVRLPYGSVVLDHEVTPGRVTLIYQRNRMRSTRNGLLATPLGVTAMQAVLTPDGEWSLVTVDLPTEADAVLFLTGKSPEERAESEAWARECYRPGTSRAPMDGASHDSPTIR